MKRRNTRTDYIHVYIYLAYIYIQVYILGHIVTWWTLCENKCWFIRNRSQRSLNRFTLPLYSNRYCVIRMVVVNPDLYDQTVQKSHSNPKLVWFVRPTGAQRKDSDLLVHKPPASRTFKVPKMHQILFSPILFRKWLEEVAERFFHPVSEDLVQLLLFFCGLETEHNNSCEHRDRL